MKRIFWEILARLGFWIPVKHYLPTHPHWDWVLISAVSRADHDWRIIPEVGEYMEHIPGWHTNATEESKLYREFFNNHLTVTHWHKLPRRLK